MSWNKNEKWRKKEREKNWESRDVPFLKAIFEIQNFLRKRNQILVFTFIETFPNRLVLQKPNKIFFKRKITSRLKTKKNKFRFLHSSFLLYSIIKSAAKRGRESRSKREKKNERERETNIVLRSSSLIMVKMKEEGKKVEIKRAKKLSLSLSLSPTLFLSFPHSLTHTHSLSLALLLVLPLVNSLSHYLSIYLFYSFNAFFYHSLYFSRV